jgi:hypothetical protein
MRYGRMTGWKGYLRTNPVLYAGAESALREAIKN